MTVCDRCCLPILPDEPTAWMTYYNVRNRPLHQRCAREWQARCRDRIILNIDINKRLNAELRSLVIHAPADPDGIELRDGQIVAGWAI